MNIAFYVSSKATRLNKIIESGNKELLQDVKVIISDDKQNIYLKEKLDVYNIKYELFDYKELKAENGEKNLVLSNEILRVLKKNNIDFCFSFGAHILKGELLNVYENKIINFHPSLLPAYPGINSIDQAIDGEESLLGNTAHFIDSGVDTGPVILQSVIPTIAFYKGNYDTVLDIQIEMLYKIYYLLKSDRIKIVNNKVEIEGADYTSYSLFPNIVC